jgi:hypothetical protein
MYPMLRSERKMDDEKVKKFLIEAKVGRLGLSQKVCEIKFYKMVKAFTFSLSLDIFAEAYSAEKTFSKLIFAYREHQSFLLWR